MQHHASPAIRAATKAQFGNSKARQRNGTWEKNFDGTGAFGPWMVTADELPPGGKGLKIQARLNGQVMQSDNTENMIFPVAEAIAYMGSPADLFKTAR